jgi:hypothetical protein
MASAMDRKIIRSIVLNTEGGVRAMVQPEIPKGVSVVPKGPMTREVDENSKTFQLHVVHISEEVRRIRKEDTDRISYTKDYERYPGNGYKTTIFHGVEGTTKKTVVITTGTGEKVVRTSRLGAELLAKGKK